MIDFLIKNVKFCDIFAEPISLKFKGQNKFRTFIGGLFSLISIGLTIYLSYDMIYDLIYRNQPLSYSLTYYYPNSPFLKLDSSELSFAFQFTDINGVPIYDESYFNFQSVLFEQNRNDTITKRNTSIVELVNCSQHYEYFNKSKSNLTNYFKLNNLQHARCISNDSLSIGGSFTSNIYRILKVYLYRCNNLTFNGKCKSSDQINQLIYGGHLQLSISKIMMIHLSLL